jgi:glycosyltransferase involved in cell wall biosynthesis
VVPDTCIRPEVPPEDYLNTERPLKVLYIGRLSVEKDQPTLIRAIRHSAFADRIQLQFAGQGPKAKKYKRMAMKLYEDGVVKYKPEFKFYSRDELRALAAGADLCVHCATIEVEGLSIMEAMQQGAVPVIAQGSHTGTSHFALSDRSVFQEKNEKELAEKIDWWLSHPKERWEEGKRYAESMKKYNIDKSAAALIDMFKAAIADYSIENCK